MQYKRIILPNGLRIVFEKIPYVQSVSIGIWIEAGSKNEQAKCNGISHFIEHMAFKGTEKRSARDIAEEIDNVGGQLNAFTGKECTCYYARVLNRHMELAFDILSDMLFNSSFRSDDISREKNVVIEEINMYQDNPEEVVHDIYASNVFKNHPLGYPVLGEQRSVMEIKREDIIRYLNNNYRPDNTVIAVTGNVELKDIERYAQKYFSNWGDRYTKVKRYAKPTINFNHVIKQRNTEQVHFCLGFKGLNQKDKRLYSFLALNNLLGGGMSSRLFQRVREEMGLVYSIYSYPTTYRDIGMLTVYAGTNPSQLGNVLEAVVEEFRKLKEYGIPENELRRVKEQMKGNYILSMEGTGGRMSSMGKSELLLGKIYSQEEILDRIDGISIDSMQEIIRESIDFENMAATILGNADNDVIKALEMMV